MFAKLLFKFGLSGLSAVNICEVIDAVWIIGVAFGNFEGC